MKPPLSLFLGYDSREPAAFHVLAHSLMMRATCPIAIRPLIQSQLRAQGCYTRERGPTESTEFSLTRFLVPYLSGYDGHSVFMDSDMLCRVDVAELWPEIERQCFWGRGFCPPPDSPQARAVLVCQHDYEPSEGIKFLGHVQTTYPRKNWSSFMVFDNARCKALTPEVVNTATGLYLHRFQWVPDGAIGCLPLTWNWLLGEYAPSPAAKMLHWTLGGPWLSGYGDAACAAEWWEERSAAMGQRLEVSA